MVRDRLPGARSALLSCGVLWGAFFCAAAAWADEERVEFSRDIRPIFSENCYKCHGPDEAERQTDFRLDTPDGARQELESGQSAIVPGKSGESLLYERITAADIGERMPPPDSGKHLSPEQIELIRRWIDQGARWQGHWSFIRPERPPLPKVKHEAAIRNGIDRFVLARLEQVGLDPAAEADKLTLLRRATLDLTGLPPSLEEIDAFLADSGPDAYEQLVDRLLASPRYGEQRARFWLDAARYGDTHGLHLDNRRSIWPYRDWVIKALSENMPFDRFTVEQLAGDLLPNATTQQRVATGFNRCNVTTSEGGSIAEEYRVRYAVDRVETTATVWLGLTAGCAVCHEHKFDPISQREFYQLFAYFNSLTEKAMDGNALLPPPVIEVPTSRQSRLRQEYRQQLADAEQAIAGELAKVAYADPLLADAAHMPAEHVWIEDALPAGAKPAVDNGPAKGWNFVSRPEHPVYSGEKAALLKAAGHSELRFKEASPGLHVGEGDKLTAYVYLDPMDPPKQIMLQVHDGTWEHRAFWGDDLIEAGKIGSTSRLSIGPLPEAGKWVRLEVDAAKVGLNPGTLIDGWAFSQYDGTAYWDRAGILTQQFESLSAWQATQRAAAKPSLPGPIQEALKLDEPKRTDAHKKLIRDHFLTYVHAQSRAVFDPLHRRHEDVKGRLTQLEKSIPSTLVMQDMDKPRDAFVLVRGQYDKHGEKVSHGVPAALGALPNDAPPNRLALAEWLVDPDNPLTARVTVNRIWQQYFGSGIVKTAEDFGSQGEWPSHPRLLDWLAVEFIQSGWNVKHLHRLIVTSATYRQSSAMHGRSVQDDPQNRLLARGPRFRMDAEMIRDHALAVSGLLVERVGGPSVRPYQPTGLWKAVGYSDSNTVNFVQDHGQALYRRSFYTFWKRTSPPPSMSTFDAPSRESCTVRRARTNTPLQALLLMNDTQFVEAARHLAQRVMTEAGESVEARIAHAFRLATARRPRSGETHMLVEMFRAHLAEFQHDRAAAAKLIGVGETPPDAALDVSQLAAWTMVANVILNLSETVTRG